MSLEDELTSGIDPKFIKIKNNYVELQSPSVNECARKCFSMSACDMFEFTQINSPRCRMFPHFSLKNYQFNQITNSQPNNTIYVLQCSTSVENILIDNDLELLPKNGSNWIFDGSNPVLRQYLDIEQFSTVLSQRRYYLNSDGGTRMTTNLSTKDLPMNISDGFPMVS